VVAAAADQGLAHRTIALAQGHKVIERLHLGQKLLQLRFGHRDVENSARQ